MKKNNNKQTKTKCEINIEKKSIDPLPSTRSPYIHTYTMKRISKISLTHTRDKE